MSSPYVHAITCSKCGAALDPQSGSQILVCSYCQTSHVFAPPPPAAAPASPQSKFPPAPLVIAGALLLVLSAAVLGVRSMLARPSARELVEQRSEVKPYEVKPASVPAEPLTPGSAPGDPLATYTPGQAVDIHWGSRWWPGQVLKKDGNRYRITYEGWASSWDEWVQADRLRPRDGGK